MACGEGRVAVRVLSAFFVKIVKKIAPARHAREGPHR